MKILSKILLSILLLSSLNSFAKGRVCSESPKDLVKNINTAFEKRNAAAFYDLISNKSISVFEKIVKNKLKSILPFVVKQLKDDPTNKANIKLHELCLTLSKSSKRKFFVAIYKLMSALKVHLREKLGMHFLSSKMNGNSGIIHIKFSNQREYKLEVIKENGCLKFNFSKKDLYIFNR